VPGSLTLKECSDGPDREVWCNRDATDGDYTCGCNRAGKLGRTFTWPASAKPVDAKDRRELEDFVRRQCHWSLVLR
jgi:hypothetical protein